MVTTTTQTGIGQPVRRKEDLRFVTGAGNYTGDIDLPGQAHLYIVRAAVAHARIRAIDTASAAAAAGVIAVYTAADLEAGGVRPIKDWWVVYNPDGTPMKEAPREALASERVRYVGQPVAAVIADTRLLARDAAELVMVDYDELPTVTGVVEATVEDAPQLYDHAPGNQCFEWSIGDADGAAAAFAAAAFTVETEIVQNRVVPNALEPRGAVASHDAARDEFTLYLSHQNPHLLRTFTCSDTLPMPESKLRVIAPDVGGGFGSKIYQYPEELVALFAAKALARPVKWIGDRSEAFLADAHGRDHVTRAELALDSDGRFTAIRVETLASLGAALSNYGAGIPTVFYATMLCGVYSIPVAAVTVRGVFTNTAPTDAYRGAGRPEAAFVIERLIDLAAGVSGIDRVELRRRNFIPADAFPYPSALGLVYDSGSYEQCLALAMKTAAMDDYEQRRAASAAAGRLRGVGITVYTEQAGAGPSAAGIHFGARNALFEVTTVRINPDASATVITGAHSHGQSHETTFAQVLSDQLGIALDRIEVLHGDTGQIPFGIGTYGSRSMSVAGSALLLSGEKIIAKGKKIAAHMLEADAADIEFLDGHFRVEGTDRILAFAEVAREAYLPGNYPLETLEPGLEETTFYDPPNFTFPCGCHVCEVEIDPETGLTTIDRYTVADDFGVVINPLVVHGQVHGGLAQGIGQALYENTVYDPDSGQLLSGTFLDYTLPRADDLPSFEVTEIDSRSPSNPLGVKGCGEAGTIGAPVTVMNAVMDALKAVGVSELQMPATPVRVWSAIKAAADRS